MRRKIINEDKGQQMNDQGQPMTKKKNLTWLKFFFILILLAAIGMYVYLYLRAPELPFPMSPEMAAIYKKHGAGTPKPRRRPDLTDEEGKAVEREKSETEAKQDMEKEIPSEASQPKQRQLPVEQSMHVGIVACGDRAPEAIISLKSFAMLSSKPLHFHVFAEDTLHKEFEKAIQEWPGFIEGRIKLDIQSIQYPVDGDFNEWKKLFKPCASQRLFFPLLLTNVDSILYVDTDVLILRPVEEMWNFFKEFNKTQVAGLAPEAEVAAIGWYNRFARHPYYGPLGVNSGVMLMNLTRMRQINWNKDVYPIYKKYRYDITWGDQDILNIMFHFKPEQLFTYPCEWNYRPDHCMYGNNCETALHRGISVVHGNRGVFHNTKQPEFKAVYEAFRETEFGDNMKQKLKQNIEKGLEQFNKKTYCGENAYMFSKLL